MPVPGVTVTAARDGRTLGAITDQRGFYSFPDLADGNWTIQLDMSGFATVRQEVAVAPHAPAAKWELKLLPLEQIRARMQTPGPPAPAPVAQARKEPPPPVEDELAQRAADGFLISGSVNNAAASAFGLPAAFGNFRGAGRGLYNGGIGVTLGNSALDARPFSLTGQNTPKASYSRVTGMAAFGGPLRIPRLVTNGPNVFLAYQWTRNSDATTAAALMPQGSMRSGVFSSPVLDPLTGLAFPAGTIPRNRISAQAESLLRFYPLPNFNGGGRYNYQVPILTPTHQDALQTRFNKIAGSRDQVYGRFAFESTRTDNPNLFGFLDTGSALGMNAGINWSHRIGQRWFLNLGYQFSRFRKRVTPYFENRIDVSGQAGIAGNSRDPRDWGPPTLAFAGGIAGLSDSHSSRDRNQTNGVSYSMLWNRVAHNIAFGADFRRQQFNFLGQQDPRGAFTFTGTASGSDFADFLLGIPTTSSIAFGNADKYFRQSIYDAYITDDWRIMPGLSVNAGLRWEYGAPVTELFGRLVNLDIAPGFSAARPITATMPERYPNSLMRPDRCGFAPRAGLAWRPVPGSSLIVRAGYGVYYDTSVYPAIAWQMAQQPPLSKTLRVQNSAANPLTLAKGFTGVPSGNTFAVDPDFQVGYAQNWQVSVQRDLPLSLQMIAAYLGAKGTRGVQEFLPNTFPAGAANPCPGCPSGFAYLASNGNSNRHAAQFQLRRRLRSGLTATLQYTFSKSIDDAAALGGQGSSPGAPRDPKGTGRLEAAQNWLDLRAERGLSSFDQRHLLSVQAQYTTGMGLAGGTLVGGWRGALLKEWTFATQITAGAGLPQTPVYLAPVQGTGVTGTIRPDYTGKPLYAAPAGLYLNPAAYTAPPPGRWGNAGRHSIAGPGQFTMNASLARTFQVTDRLNLDLRVDSTNPLNHVAYTAWNATVNSAQFGLPAAASAMRSLQTTLRLRF
ncbi:MAG: carboxypeptidase regulatory-like domain-containing protein [Bryobacteraceae bacterium]